MSDDTRHSTARSEPDLETVIDPEDEREVDPLDVGPPDRVLETEWEADPADALDQRRDVPLDDDR